LQQLSHKLSGWICTGLSISLWLVQLVAATFRRQEASHDHTCGSGFHTRSGGPTRDTNIKDDKCFTVMVLQNSLQTRFIQLKPISHSAVLTGSVTHVSWSTPQHSSWYLCSPDMISLQFTIEWDKKPLAECFKFTFTVYWQQCLRPLLWQDTAD